MTPPEPTTTTILQSRSSVELARGSKGVNPTVKIYVGDEDVTLAAEKAKAAFLELDAFCRKQAE